MANQQQNANSPINITSPFSASTDLMNWKYLQSTGFVGGGLKNTANTNLQQPDFLSLQKGYRSMLSTPSYTDTRRGRGSYRPQGGAGFNPVSGWAAGRTSNPFEAQAFGAALNTGGRLLSGAAAIAKNTKLYSDIYNAMNQLPTITPASSGSGGTGGTGGTGGGGGGNQPTGTPVSIPKRRNPFVSVTGSDLIARRQFLKNTGAFPSLSTAGAGPSAVNTAPNDEFVPSGNIPPYLDNPNVIQTGVPRQSPFLAPTPAAPAFGFPTGNQIVAKYRQGVSSSEPATKQRKARTPKKPKAPKES